MVKPTNFPNGIYAPILNSSDARIANIGQLAGSLTGTVDGTLADVAAIALSTSDTYTDSAVNTAVNTAITATNLQLKELQTKVNALEQALEDAQITAAS